MQHNQNLQEALTAPDGPTIPGKRTGTAVQFIYQCRPAKNWVKGEAMQDTTFDLLREASVSTITQVLERLGISRTFLTGVSPRTSSVKMVGRARTLRCVPVRGDVLTAQRESAAAAPHRMAFDGVGTGEVIVIEARGVLEAAVLGDLLAGRAAMAGAAGIVTDGAVRDSTQLDRYGLPIFASGFQAATFSTQHIGLDVNVPIACAGVLVLPEDVLVSDGEGVVCVPAGVADHVAAEAAQQEQRDVLARQELFRGSPLADSYPEQNSAPLQR